MLLKIREKKIREKKNCDYVSFVMSNDNSENRNCKICQNTLKIQLILQVMSGVRLPLLSRDFLMNNVEHEEILTSDTFCKVSDIVEVSMKKGLWMDGWMNERV